MANTKDFRQGHRERVRARFLREGLTPFQDYEVIELLLFYAVPRRDTKPLAHALIEKFGTLERVLLASQRELCDFPGIGERTATLLRSVLPFMRYVALEEPHNAIYTDEKSLAEYFYKHFDKTQKTGSALVLMNNRNEVIRHFLLSEENGIALLSTGSLPALAFSYRASQIALADYKDDGIPFPNSMLLQNISHLREELQSVGIHLYNYLMLAGKQYNSVLRMLDGARLETPSTLFLDTADCPKHDVCERSVFMLTELLSVVLSENEAKECASALLQRYGTLAALLSVPYRTLIEENASLAAPLLFLQIVAETYSNANVSRVRRERKIYKSASEIGKMFCDTIGTNCEETVALGLFDEEMHLIDIVLCARGSVNTASVVIRSMMETAVACHAAYIAIAHNHPSGTTEPSGADASLTAALYDALHRVNIRFLDHFIVTEREAFPISRRLSRYTDADDSFYEE